MEKGKCEKCGKMEYLEIHHILPKSTFGKNEEISKICPNCHTKYHQLLGTEGLKNPDMVFHFAMYFKWLAGLLPLLFLLFWFCT